MPAVKEGVKTAIQERIDAALGKLETILESEIPTNLETTLRQCVAEINADKKAREGDSVAVNRITIKYLDKIARFRDQLTKLFRPVYDAIQVVDAISEMEPFSERLTRLITAMPDIIMGFQENYDKLPKQINGLLGKAEQFPLTTEDVDNVVAIRDSLMESVKEFQRKLTQFKSKLERMTATATKAP